MTLFEFTKHNALVGCIEETWAALLAVHQVQHAPRYQKVFSTIAKDEIGHAQYSWDTHKWLMQQLSPQERIAILKHMRTKLNMQPTPYDSHTQYGEMDRQHYHKVWKVFCTQIEDRLEAA